MNIDLAAMQILALQAAESNDWEHEYRRICRWYSITFFTPLHLVEMELAEEYILQHYFEYTLRSLYDKGQESDNAEKRENWAKVRENILALMDKNIQKNLEDIENEDDAWAEELRQQIIKEEKEAEEAKNKKSKKIESKQEFAENQPNLTDEVEFNLFGE